MSLRNRRDEERQGGSDEECNFALHSGSSSLTDSARRPFPGASCASSAGSPYPRSLVYRPCLLRGLLVRLLRLRGLVRLRVPPRGLVQRRGVSGGRLQVLLHNLPPP